MGPPRLLGHRLFVDGARRPVHAEPDGRQYVPGYDGEKVYGVWLLVEEDECDVPVVVEERNQPRVLP